MKFVQEKNCEETVICDFCILYPKVMDLTNQKIFFEAMRDSFRELQILQSSRVWSSAPYDTESTQILKLLAALTPVRTFYRPHLRVMQQIKQPNRISSLAAQDSYLAIVQKLISDSQRLMQLHFQIVETKIESKTILP